MVDEYHGVKVPDPYRWLEVVTCLGSGARAAAPAELRAVLER